MRPTRRTFSTSARSATEWQGKATRKHCSWRVCGLLSYWRIWAGFKVESLGPDEKWGKGKTGLLRHIRRSESLYAHGLTVTCFRTVPVSAARPRMPSVPPPPVRQAFHRARLSSHPWLQARPTPRRGSVNGFRSQPQLPKSSLRGLVGVVDWPQVHWLVTGIAGATAGLPVHISEISGDTRWIGTHPKHTTAPANNLAFSLPRLRLEPSPRQRKWGAFSSCSEKPVVPS